MDNVKWDIDYKSAIPVYEQIKLRLKMDILAGQLKSDEKIKSVREMTRLTKVNQNTIIKSYYQLEQEGFIYSRPGRGYFVTTCGGNRKEEKWELFSSITKSYLEKTISLGFSVKEAINELEKLL